MKNTPTPSYGYEVLTAPLPFEVGPKDVLKSNTSNRRKNTNAGNTGKSRKPHSIGKASMIVKTYKLPIWIVEQVERIAFWQRKKIQDVMAEALTMYLDAVPDEDRQPIPIQET